MTTDQSCLSLVHEGEVQIISFLNTRKDLMLIFEQLRTSRVVQEVRLRDVQDYHDIMLVLFSMAIRAHPSIKRLSFENSTFDQFAPIIEIANSKLPALEFRNCSIHSGAAEALHIWLVSGMIHELIFDQCTFLEGALDQIAAGVRETTTLRSFSYYWGSKMELDLLEAIRVMLARNENLETLCLDLYAAQRADHAILQAIETGKTLKCLHLRGLVVTLPTMQHIIRMYATTESFRELDFSESSFQKKALGLLLDTLSAKPAIIETLHLPALINTNDISDNQIARNQTYYRTVMTQVAALKVSRLVLHCEPLISRWLVNEIARAGFIQHLDLRDCSPDLFDIEIRHLLMLSSRPMELVLGSKLKPTVESGAIANESRRYDHGLRIITCRILGGTIDLVDFARRLVNLPSLHKLTVHQCKGLTISDEFLATIANTLTQNKSLHTLSLHGLSPTRNDVVHNHLVKIRHSLTMNRVGHLRLMTCDDRTVPTWLWARLLGRSSFDPDGMFFVLTNKPDIAIIHPGNLESVAPSAASDAELDDTDKPTKRIRYS